MARDGPVASGMRRLHGGDTNESKARRSSSAAPRLREEGSQMEKLATAHAPALLSALRSDFAYSVAG